MLVRGRFDYTLPAEKSREAPRGKNMVTPAPMPNDKIKHGWTGETKEQLLAKPDMLPPYVRALPRAYLVAPRASSSEKKSLDRKRKQGVESHAPSSFPLASTAYTAAPRLPQFLAPPSFPRPPADARHGEVLTTSWSWITNTWEHVYASGARVSAPPQNANSTSSAEVRFVRSLLCDLSLTK